ncbi:MAG: hypothetical protein ACYC67_25345 [Prosthecobacter sp.]
MNAAQNLNLDPQLMRASAEAYYGYAHAERKDAAAELTEPARIDYLTIAASYFAVVNPRRATECFTEAADAAFRFAQKQKKESLLIASEWFARASTLSICGNSPQGFNSPRFNDEQQRWGQTPNQKVAELIFNSKSFLNAPGEEYKSDELKRSLKAAGGFEGRVVGKMRMPMSLYTKIAQFALQGGK